MSEQNEQSTIVQDQPDAEASTITNGAGAPASIGTGINTDTFHYRLSVFTRAFEATIVHGVDAAVSGAKRAVEAFDELFSK